MLQSVISKWHMSQVGYVE